MKISAKPAKQTKPGNVFPPKAVALLKRYTTARQLARGAKVSKVHSYRLIQLIGQQHPLQMKLIREKATGPMSKAYRFKRS